MDRVAPTLRPNGKVVMRAAWRHLLFLHWEVPASALSPLIPSGLDLDLHDGRAYIGLVPFTMENAFPLALDRFGRWPRWWRDYHEVNVRTYVHRSGRDPGVWFFSLDAANAPAVLAARTWFRLPYFYARIALAMRHGGSVMNYRSRRLWPGPRHAGCKISATISGAPAAAVPGSLEHFLVERYILYSQAGGRLYQGRVHHAPYPLQSASLERFDENLIAAAGVVRPPGAPLVHYAAGVDTEILGLERVT